ncbi:ribosome-binding factor A [Thermincola ferriacetica]|uniref:Ribosome-binding factor A n=2 Tax=Thermincola TaxID=278993 RepID=D5XF14_THEPJ|nr:MULTISPECIES: 30S ribosome-binding factor RbfA [Thermincola]ADG82235.1 ribosome-binding factor A [Thermincola potens JR]KNZ68259.1 ribosome-binding factor A [Thermincola ferriacetica]
MSGHRASRVAEAIKKEVTQMLGGEIKDPRIGFVTVTGVEVCPDLRHARIYISVYGSDEEKAQTLQALNKAKGFVRSELGKRIRLRYTPEVEFRFDESIERGARIMELLNRVQKDGGNDEQ